VRRATAQAANGSTPSGMVGLRAFAAARVGADACVRARAPFEFALAGSSISVTSASPTRAH
jgi:hypothetical protein